MKAYHAPGVTDHLVSFVFHSAVWHLIGRLPSPLLVAVAVLSGVLYFARRRSRQLR